MWKSLGFIASPYSSSPLAARVEDVDLLIGRTEESVKLQTLLDSKPEGVIILSGTPGVGKTSFLNINQYLMEAGKSPFGPALLAARHLSPVQSDDKPRDIALRALHFYLKGIQEYCYIHSKRIPDAVEKTQKWLSSPGSSGFSIGVSVMGFGGSFGRTASVPKVDDASFESLKEVFEYISAEVRSNLGVPGSVVVLDNIENLNDETLASVLMTFRDTLFTVAGIWWVLIGQSGLYGLVQSLDPRVSERISGSGVELAPITIKELHEAIDKRVKRFHSSGSGQAPLPPQIHEKLYNASHGEIRFVFKYSETICVNFVTRTRENVIKRLNGRAPQDALDVAIGALLVNGIVKKETGIEILKQTISADLDGYGLRPKDLSILNQIGKTGSARPKDHAKFGLKTQQDFSSNFLSNLYSQHLLIRQQEGRAVTYRLRGVAAIAYEFNLLTKAASGQSAG